MSKRLRYVAILLFCWSGALASAPSADAFETMTMQLQQRLQSARRPAGIRVAGEPLRAGRTLKHFYAQRAYQPAWHNAGGPSLLADHLIESLVKLEQEGLDPHDYHFRKLETLLAEARQSAAPDVADKRVELELLLSDAFLSAARHLTAGRLQPVKRGSKAKALDAEAAGHLERALRERRLADALQGLLPSDAAYTQLRQALAKYRQIAAAGGWPIIPLGQALKAGMESERVAVLRARLQATGDFTRAIPPQMAGSNRYDAMLERAVNRFQERHGLATDGVVGPNTLSALNVPAPARVRQLILNLERLRRQASTFDDRHIVVNIPNYRMHVMEKGESVLTMRVVVGKPSWQTPTFQATMTHLVVNPYWVVPDGIKRREIVPRLKKDPSYLQRQNLEVLQGSGRGMKIINPNEIDWSTVSTRNFPYRVRQRPGSRNALGRVKFKFPNRYHVYMHDTPARALFAKPKRAFSHGCVRLERPTDLAAYLLQDNPAWPVERIERAMQGGRSRHVNLKEPIDVHLIYQTAWVDEEGRAQFRPDIYGLDKKHQRALCGASYSGCN